ncbi:FAD/NAD(P)-binding protein [Streptomyces sp. NPDC004682]
MRIAIIGGGAAAVALVHRLVTGQQGTVEEICVYEPTPDIGPGRAYRADLPEALVNLPNAGMSIDNAEPDDLLGWLARSPWSGPGEPSGPHDFLPRPIYGRYLRYCFLRAQYLGAERGIVVRAVHQSVADLHDTGQHVIVHTSGGQQFDHDQAVLCLGTAAPDNPYGLIPGSTFIADPYPLRDTLPRIPAGRRVLVLGTGLTAVDVAAAVLRHDPEASVVLSSRRGVLPGVRNPQVWTTARHSTPEHFGRLCANGQVRTLADVWSFVEDELRARGLDPAHARREFGLYDHGVVRLERQLADVRTSSQWRDVVIATLNPVVAQAWQTLAVEQKRHFLTRWLPAYVSFMNPMPPRTAGLLTDAHRAGRLTVQAGITGLYADRAGYTLHAEGGSRHVDLVVNAVNASVHSVAGRAVPLVRRLMVDGNAMRSEFGGLRTDPATGRLLTASGTAHPRLFALGQLAVGDLLLTNSVRAIARQAAVVAEALAPRLFVPAA